MKSKEARLIGCLALLILLATTAGAQKINMDTLNKELLGYFQASAFDKAEQLVLHNLPLLRKDKHKNDSLYAATLYNVHLLYAHLNQEEKALAILKELDEKVIQVYGEKSLYYYLVLHLYRMQAIRYNDYAKAAGYLHHCKTILEALMQTGKEYETFYGKIDKEGMRYQMKITLTGIAAAYAMQYKNDTAKKYFKEAANYLDTAYYIKSDIHAFISDARGYASFLTRHEELEAAEEIYTKAKHWLEKINAMDHPAYADLLLFQADFYSTINKDSIALEQVRQAKEILERNFETKTTSYVNVLVELAAFYYKIADFEKAEIYLLQALRTLKGMKKKDYRYIQYILTTNTNLIRLYISQKKWEEVTHHFQTLDSVFQNEANRSLYLYNDYVYYKAEYEANRQNFAVADSLITIYIKREATGNQRAYGYALLLKANNYWAWNKKPLAKKAFLEGLFITKDLIAKNFTFFSESQKQSYLAHFNQHYNILHSRLQEDPDPELLTIAMELQTFLKGLLLNTSPFAVTRKQKTNSGALYQQYRELKKRIAEGYFDNALHTIKVLEKEAEALEKKLSKQDAANIRKEFEQLTVADLRARLQEGEALVDFFQFQKGTTVYYGALVLKKEKKLPDYVILFEQKTLEQLYGWQTGNTNEWINKLYMHPLGDNRTPSIYGLVWQPLEKFLSGIKTVFLSPVGALHTLSFAALPVSEEAVLSDRYTVRMISSPKVLADRETLLFKAPTTSIALFGGIDYNTDAATLLDLSKKYTTYSLPATNVRAITEAKEWNYLPGTEKEVTHISSLFAAANKKLLNGKQATEEAFMHMSGRSSQIIHVATHGFTYAIRKQTITKEVRYGDLFKTMDNPLLRTGLIFSGANASWTQKQAVKGVKDGIVTGYDVSLMDLSKTKLAVLSACETGLGTIEGNEGIFGFIRSFKMAGVKTVLTTLWKIPDEPTFELMHAFYTSLLKGQPVHLALREAQLLIRKKYGEPYFWAGFVVTE